MKNNLKSIIKDRGIKISWVAKNIGISQPLLSMKLNGNATMDNETKENICELLNVNIKDML